MLLVQFLSSCATYKIPTENFYVPDRSTLDEKERNLYEEYQLQAANHWLYRIVPRHRSQIKCYDWGHSLTWALFGNDDEGLFAEAQSPLFRPEP